jgi:hypothetical protein
MARTGRARATGQNGVNVHSRLAVWISCDVAKE